MLVHVSGRVESSRVESSQVVFPSLESNQEDKREGRMVRETDERTRERLGDKPGNLERLGVRNEDENQ